MFIIYHNVCFWLFKRQRQHTFLQVKWL
jgi:hypothetical protein